MIAPQEAMRGASTRNVGRSGNGGLGPEALRAWYDLTPTSKSLADTSVNQEKRIARGTKGASHFTWAVVHPRRPTRTITATLRLIHWAEPRHLSDGETVRIMTFPDDYDFGEMDVNYVCGMSVPPRMMECVATEIRRQWLDARTETDAA
jgi:DNA (cytosine-5)-methyltransferase 1